MKKAVSSAALLFALALVLAACGGSDKPAGSPAPAAPATSAAAAGGTTVAVATVPAGDVLVDGEGRTLYVFTKDKGDQTSCSGDCATSWPALKASSAPTAGPGVDAAKLAVAKQADGSSQVTYNGMLLYHFAGDTKAGDINGQGIGGVWWVLGPDGQPIKTKS
jgi:predicted lipoprotein with Yx(FWY)xxD motif